jgi:AcrR family transcriptional regulator
VTDALRAEARDNRERILEVARAVFAADGLNVPMREIARRAEVGPATLYRRFPAKEALVTGIQAPTPAARVATSRRFAALTIRAFEAAPAFR